MASKPPEKIIIKFKDLKNHDIFEMNGCAYVVSEISEDKIRYYREINFQYDSKNRKCQLLVYLTGKLQIKEDFQLDKQAKILNKSTYGKLNKGRHIPGLRFYED